MTTVTIRIRKTEEATKPSYAHPGDAGMDLYSTEDVNLAPMERKLVSTGIFLEIPQGFEAQIRPKSGLAIEKGLTLVNTPGTIDSGYRGEIKVIMINLGRENITLSPGSKIAQMVFAKVEEAQLIDADELENTQRGDGGFGSTGE